VSDYKIPATESVIAEGALGKEALGKVDAFLGERKPSSVIKIVVMASMTGLSENEAMLALDAYCKPGVLKKEEMVSCDECGTLTDAEEVRSAREAGDECVCDGTCGEDLVPQDAEVVVVYRLLDTL
jgi:hypothetical protein